MQNNNQEEKEKFNFSEKELEQYSNSYSDENFRSKLEKNASKLLKTTNSAKNSALKLALTLYYVLKSASTPLAFKILIVGALGYLILPFDIIPDMFPGVGFVDDIAALGTAYASIKSCVTEEVENNVATHMKKFIKK